jgi:ABC-type phosphonate transport system ATPase subunit
MTTPRLAHPRPRHSSLRKDEPQMQHIELRLAEIAERQALMRSDRDAERDGLRPGRSIRHQLGESLVRLGRRIGGDTLTAPAWQG